ncbi:HAD family hydrolase [Rhodanobacter glycinis]|uniref:HAD-IC family P-type ATPase n=1 Tax=Rhodanobacter glycinis TaxID=582702 RepID=UPI00112E8DCE|nr:HAD-IC family P-type ATPase [Rhodanobacter glycinis]TPG50868.1 HAD family hydrolase [Rhodanobacter glycinis]
MPTTSGLSSAEAHRRLAEYGANAIDEKTPSRWRLFLTEFGSPIAWMLELAMAFRIVRGAYGDAAMIGALLLFNAVLGFVQEGRASAALAALKTRLAPMALVLRDGEWVRLAAVEVVPGDVVRLALGALVPADARILSGTLQVDQSMLTGESVPVDADAGAMIYAGALVRRGQAVAEVTATGARTAFGKAAELVRIAHSVSTEQKAIFGVTRNLMLVNGTIAAFLLIYAYASDLPPIDVIRLAITAVLASIPAALPATFTLSAALSARTLAARGVLLTRLSAAHEAAAMDVLCADKTGTLTQNRLEVAEVCAMHGFDRDQVLTMAAWASSEADQDPIDAAVRKAASASDYPVSSASLVRFVPFDPATRIAEAWIRDAEGVERRIVKGAFQEIAGMVQAPGDTRAQVDKLAGAGHRVLAVATGSGGTLMLAGLLALSDPPRKESRGLIATLDRLGVRTLMMTGDSATTAEAIARKVGITAGLCPTDHLADADSADRFGVFARVVPEQKYQLVQALQRGGHVVGMCGDGTNDAPALRQAQIGIAVSTATDVAKAAAGMVLTEPGLGGIVFAVREGRVAFGRLLTYSLNMLLKKIEIILFLAVGLVLTGEVIMTPVLMVLMLMTNDFLAMSLTTDHASLSPVPIRWHMRNIMAIAFVFGLCKLAFSTAMLMLGKYGFGLGSAQLQTLAFVTLVIGAQACMYVVRERRRLWSSRPSIWILASSVVDIGIASALSLTGTLMAPMPWRLLAVVLAAAMVFALLLDQVKRPVLAAFEMV